MQTAAAKTSSLCAPNQPSVIGQKTSEGDQEHEEEECSTNSLKQTFSARHLGLTLPLGFAKTLHPGPSKHSHPGQQMSYTLGDNA